jgi:lipopolysaccharide transport system permease protein
MPSVVSARWGGDLRFLLRNLLLKDFRIRYRNMSLGLGWSLANPLVMMGVLTFVFTKVFADPANKHFPAFVLCGLVPFNFFSISWATGTTSIIDNASLIKRVRFPREIIPVSTVLAQCLHFGIQLGLLLILVLASGYHPGEAWAWLPVVILLEIVFACGMALLFSAINVYVRDTKYLVESANTVLFWLVPVFYSFTVIPARYIEVYRFNPIAAVVMAFRNILLENKEPAGSLMLRLALVSTLTLLLGLSVFRRLRRRFYDYL